MHSSRLSRSSNSRELLCDQRQVSPLQRQPKYADGLIPRRTASFIVRSTEKVFGKGDACVRILVHRHTKRLFFVVRKFIEDVLVESILTELLPTLVVDFDATFSDGVSIKDEDGTERRVLDSKSLFLTVCTE